MERMIWRCPYCPTRMVYADRATLEMHVRAWHPIHEQAPRDLDAPVPATMRHNSRPPKPKRVSYSRWYGRS
jgi:hypothetical protein